MASTSLLDVNDSLLIVIDIQPSFVKKENSEDHNPLLQRMCWIIKVAAWLKVPLIVTSEIFPIREISLMKWRTFCHQTQKFITR